MTKFESSLSARLRRRCAPLLVACGAILALAACQTTVPGGQQASQAPQGGVAPGQVVPPPPPSGNPTPDAARPVPAGQAKVAALLPLSGPNAAIGQSLLEAMRLAFNDARGGVPVELLSRDTGGTPEGAKRAAESALQAGATLLVGPLLGGEVPAVAEVSRGAGVPVLSFTNNAAAASPNVYALGILPQTQVDRLVGFARAKGARRFALVAPDDLYGKIIEDSFRNVVGGGGQVVAVERYAGNMNGVSNAVKRVASAGGGADAILLAGNGDNLLLAATFVPYYDIDTKKTQVLVATVGWDDPRLQQEAALFGAYMAAPLTPKREEFTRRFKQSYNKDAPLLASLGYDAAALAIAAIRDGSESGLTPALINPSGFEGYDGVFRLRPDGTNQRLLPILQFQRGGAKQVEEPSSRFVDLTQ